jgi:hypothetical protein
MDNDHLNESAADRELERQIMLEMKIDSPSYPVKDFKQANQSKGKNIRILKKNLNNNTEDTLAVEEYDLK